MSDKERIDKLERELTELRHKEQQKEDNSSFTDSAIIGAVTNSAILGGILGGNIVGGLVGDLFNGGNIDD